MRTQRLIRLTILIIIAGLSLFFVFNSASAKVTGSCVNCHTMHNSQGGADMATFGGETGPNNALTRGSCVGCHSAATGDIWKDGTTGAPIVYNIVEPSFNAAKGLAGGNFYWVAQGDDNKGHNVLGISSADESLSEAPGKIGGCGGCHLSLATEQTMIPDFGSGCEGCHLNVAHHANDDPSGEYKLVITAEQGWYRFLSGHKGGDGHGVEGGEDPDWQADATSSVHNEYLGKVDSTGAWGFSGGKLGHTTTAFCTGCHGLFHSEQNSGDAWIRHPSDAVIPDSGEYSAYTVYNPGVPVARPSLVNYSVPSATVEPGTDMVMCLSCHRPHGSEYSDLLRWDYNTMIAGGGGADGTGCFVCHTNKDSSS